MKVLVTGASGFLGSHLVDFLLREGHSVHVLIRQTSNIQWLLGKKIQYHFGDLADSTAPLEKVVEGIELCFHVAGVIRANRPEDYFKTHRDGTRRLLDSLLKEKRSLKRVVIVSSIAAQGPGLEKGPIWEEDEPHPMTDYGQSKLEEEKVALGYRDRLPITIIRPPGIWGNLLDRGSGKLPLGCGGSSDRSSGRSKWICNSNPLETCLTTDPPFPNL